MTEHHDRDTVIVERDSGSGMAMILGIIVVVALLAAVWFFTLGPGAGRSTTTDQGGGTTEVAPSVALPASS